MAFHIPTQTRAVDPYSSYNSDNVNQLTRIISRGNDVVAQGLDVDVLSSTSVRLQTGVAIKDDVMVNIIETLDIPLTDGSWFVEGTPIGSDTTGYIYVIMDYNFQKVSPPNSASIKILKNTGTFSSHANYMFIKALKISGGVTPVIQDILDYDPSNPTVTRRGAAVQVVYVDTLPPWNISLLGLLYLINGGTSIAIGGPTGWVYFPTDSTSTIHVDYYENGSLPTWDSSYIGKLYVVGGSVYLAGPSGWIDLTSDIVGVGSVDGVSNPGGDVDFIAGTNITITPDNIGKTVTFDVPAQGQSIENVSNPGGNIKLNSATLIINGDNVNKEIDIESMALMSINGMYSPYSNIDLVGGGNISITPNNTTKEIIISAATQGIVSVAGVSNSGGDVALIGTEGISIVPDPILKRITFKTSTSGGGTTVSNAKVVNLSTFTSYGDHLSYADAVHNLDCTAYCAIELFDDVTDTKISPYDIEKIDNNTIRIYFDDPQVSVNAVVVSSEPADIYDEKNTQIVSTWTADGDLFYSDVIHATDATTGPCFIQIIDTATNKVIRPAEIKILDTNTFRLWLNVDGLTVSVLTINGDNGGNKYTGLISAYTSSLGLYYADVNHALGSTAGLLSKVFDSAGFCIYPLDVQITDANTVRYWFTEDPGTVSIILVAATVGATSTGLALSKHFEVSSFIDAGSSNFYCDLTHNFDSTDALFVTAFRSATKRLHTITDVELLTANVVRVWFTGDPAQTLKIRVIR